MSEGSIQISEEDPVIAAAGDIACMSSAATTSTACQHLATSEIIFSGTYSHVLALGDNQYQDGSLEQYNDGYDPTWGRLKEKTLPVPGNHEYRTANAAGYFDYFGARAGETGKGYYSVDIGKWHIVALNSNCQNGFCSANSEQVTWLRADLEANAALCTLLFWHHPRFSTGEHGNNTTVAHFWNAAYEFNADLILVGHDHDYERFAPQNPSGQPDEANGIRQFVVGTGGRSLDSFLTTSTLSEIRQNSSFGILQLKLHESGYSWKFVPIESADFEDEGTGTCH